MLGYVLIYAFLCLFPCRYLIFKLETKVSDSNTLVTWIFTKMRFYDLKVICYFDENVYVLISLKSLMHRTILRVAMYRD